MGLVPVVIALGSNVFPTATYLDRALAALRDVIPDATESPRVRSAPMYRTDQPEFLNSVVEGRTLLGPVALLRWLKRQETELGRQPRERNGPREIDLDLIVYGSLILRFGEELIVPHPRWAERPFVVAPMSRLPQDVYVPGVGSVREFAKRTEWPPESVQFVEG